MEPRGQLLPAHRMRRVAAAERSSRNNSQTAAWAVPCHCPPSLAAEVGDLVLRQSHLLVAADGLR
eukprot:540763-Pyramimonas_sp.AAC.1